MEKGMGGFANFHKCAVNIVNFICNGNKVDNYGGGCIFTESSNVEMFDVTMSSKLN